MARQEQQSLSLARRGLRMAVSDIVETLQDLPPAEVEQCDRALDALGAYTLSALRQQHSSRYRRLLRRGSIRDDSEFYLARGIESDMASELPDYEREQLQQMMRQYAATRKA